MTQTFVFMKLSEVICFNPFTEQRDANQDRINKIKEVMISRVNKGQSLTDIPIVLVVDKNGDQTLRDKTNKRVNTCIVDGQHRMMAMRKLVELNSRYNNLDVPCFMNMVSTIQEARSIQYSLFEQKPVDLIDKLVKTDYSIGDEIRACICLLEQYISDNSFTSIKFKNRYSDVKQKRLDWFMKGELEHYIRNSPNIAIWNQKEISGIELFDTIMMMAQRKKDKFDGNNHSEVLIITKVKNIKKFNEKCIDNLLAYISFPYTNKYDELVHDIEIDLNIIEDVESEEEFEDCD